MAIARAIEHEPTAAVHESSWKAQHSPAHGAGDGELAVGMKIAEAGGPPHEIVGEHRASKPRRVGEELARRAVLEPGTFFQVADGELDAGVVTVKRIRLNSLEIHVRDEAVVTPVRP